MKKQLTKIVYESVTPILAQYNIKTDIAIDLKTPPDKSKGDISLNIAMVIAKPAKTAPMQLAEMIVSKLAKQTDFFEKVEAVKPGFINLFLKDKMIEESFNDTFANSQPICIEQQQPQTIVIDYSSVNIAKQMHVGHLRSTIIGDVLSRVLEELGHKVIRQNHLGDWGLPIAMVLSKAAEDINEADLKGVPLEKVITLQDLENYYKEATLENKEGKKDRQFHENLLKLQASEPDLLHNWQRIVRISMNEVYRVYEQLDVKLTQNDECGESFYRNMLEDTVSLIESYNVVQTSQGAKCVFLDDFKGKDGEPLPVIIQKSDGGYNYSTFDLAALHHRTDNLKANRVIYVTDSRQSLHFSQIFAVAQLSYLSDRHDVSLEHVTFGSILGEDKKPLKTRSGENVKLAELLKEAIEKAHAVVQEKNPTLSAEYQMQVAKMVGTGAVKYSDLSQNRNNDYVFSFDRMLALNGNTAPYLQYAHARICSIFKKAGFEPDSFVSSAKITTSEERDLILKVMDFEQILVVLGKELRPHLLCNYLFELATCFTTFYDKCRVLNNEDLEMQSSRLSICNAVRKTLSKGLDLLGISAPREM